ncbi:MAG: antibiotic biosynthesis monooxygenase [Bacteroidetes bacterium]|nr:antibiotic biosynthesis monooxygenase [Bacteroidota bacterium]
MIVRIVKMTFRPNEVSAFLEIFAEIKFKISSFEGCRKLELLHDNNDPRIMITRSLWDNEASLEAYRNSELFISTWTRTKALFDDKAEAWTMTDITDPSNA